jgi:hypothetical protein
MPLCARCHQKEATVHFTTVMDGKEPSAAHLCKDCASSIGFDFDYLNLKEIEALSVTGKRCGFCGKEAISGQIGAKDGAIYWCSDCGEEFTRILSAELAISAPPDLMRRGMDENLFLSFCYDPELKAWSEAASQRAVQILRQRRRADGRDPGGKA